MCLAARECRRHRGRKNRSAVGGRFDANAFQPSHLECFLEAYLVKVQGLHVLRLYVIVVSKNHTLVCSCVKESYLGVGGRSHQC